MLSFMNMGGARRKRRRSKKSTPPPSSYDNILAPPKGASLRGSASFMSPGDLGEGSQKNSKRLSYAQVRKLEEKGPMNQDKDLPIPQRSPEIQLEFKHDSLLQSMPGEFLRRRNGSIASSADDAMSVKPGFTHAPSTSTSTLEGSPRQKGENSRRVRRPSVAPIHIPVTPVQSIPLQLRRRASRASRKSRSIRTSVQSPPSPAWASDSELDPVSAVSGMSAARDVLSKSFSFSARTPATGFGFGDGTPATREKRDSDAAVFAKEMGQRIARQDSATLPRDLIWESALETKSVSRKSSSQSLKKRKRDAVIPIDPLPTNEAFITLKQDVRSGKSPIKGSPKRDEQSPSSGPTRKDSLFRARSPAAQKANPPPRTMTPGTQKLDFVDQIALHRISRIIEGDTEASSGAASPALSPPNSGFRKQKFSLGSPRTASSNDATSPSLYSAYSSPQHSPGKRSGPPSSRTDSDLESFLDGFTGKLRDQQSSRTKSPKSPLSAKDGGLSPLSPTSISSSLSPASGSAGALLRNISERQSKRSSPSQPTSGSSTPSKAGSQTTYCTVQTKISKSTAITSPTRSLPNSARGQKPFLHFREDSSSSIASSTVKTPASGFQNKCTPILPRLEENVWQAENSPSIYSMLSPRIDVKSPEAGTPDSEKRRPSLPQLRLNSVMLSPSALSAGSPPDQSPDLLDMLIPNGHLITPISGHKRTGSTPSPIKIVNMPQKYSPVNGDANEEGLDSAGKSYPGQNSDTTPSTGEYGQTAQTFPETPVLFSPEFPQELPAPDSSHRRLSRSMSATSLRKFAFTRMNSLLKTASTVQPIIIPSTPRIPVTLEEKSAESRAEKEAAGPATPDSPLISPLEPPPSSLAIHETPKIPMIQVASPRRPSPPPILAPAPKKKSVRARPPLPFGPRKPSRTSINKTSPLSFASKRKTVSESAVGIIQTLSAAAPCLKESDNPLASPALETPTFKTTPVPWRGLTLEAAKWTFTSAQLQDIVRHAIAKSSEASAIRLLPPDILGDELPVALQLLEERKADVESNYKVQVRRRRALLMRLTAPPSSPTSILQVAEELTGVTATCDRLVEELHDVCDQISQVNRLKDVHLASALAMALRKLNASLIRRTTESRKVELDLANLYAEYEEAWRKVEEKDREILSLQEQLESSFGPGSKRSSRASLALSRRSSRRASEARMQLSGSSFRRQSQRSSRSSLAVNLPTSQRATFTFAAGDPGVPPVPPLPTQSTGSRYSDLTTSHTLGSSALSTGLPSDGLYHAVYDMLGVHGKDRAMPSPARPVSTSFDAGPALDSDRSNSSGNGRDALAKARNLTASQSDEHLPLPQRRVSLPLNAHAHQDVEMPDAEFIIAMLDL